MNERIKELAIQAAGKGFQTFATSHFDSQAKIQKFAELIMQDAFQHLTNIGQDYAREQLERHYGVE